MRLFVGLGNPGDGYVNTRHNVGYLIVDKLFGKKLPEDIVVKKTGTFMNDSGVAVKKLCDKYAVSTDNLYIVHDDLDLPLGTWKIQFAKGPKDNGGINSIEQVLATDKFWRIRVGIDNRKPEPRGCKTPRGEAYVLQDFPADERAIIDRVGDDVCKKLATL